MTSKKQSLDYSQGERHVTVGDHKIDCGGPVQQVVLSGVTGDVVVLLQEGISTKETLRVFSFEGAEVAKFSPPEGFEFYYLSETGQGGVGVVCVTDEPIGDWYDWLFSIDLKNGRLERISPSK